MNTTPTTNQTTTPPISRFVAYYRCSTEEQAKGGHSMAWQRDVVQRALKERGYELLHEYEEVTSGHQSAKPGLMEALAKARDLKARLIVAELSRLTRDPREAMAIAQGDVPVIVLSPPITDMTTLLIHVAVAHSEATRISERTRAALAVSPNKHQLFRRSKIYSWELCNLVNSLKAKGLTTGEIHRQLKAGGVKLKNGAELRYRDVEELQYREKKNEARNARHRSRFEPQITSF